MATTMKPLVALKRYLYDKESGQTIAEFAQECAALDKKEKIELATMICDEMGCKLELTA